MDLSWHSIENLANPDEYGGMITLALFMLIMAWCVSVVTTRLFQFHKSVPVSIRLKFDKTIVRYIIRIKNLLIFITTFIIYASLVPAFESFINTIIAGTGIATLAIGFAAKSTISNLIAGFFLAIYRPVRIGDKVSINGEYSTVEDITLRHTIVRSLQNKRIIIPNCKLDEMTLINYSIIDPGMLCTVEMGVSYDTDLDLARRLIMEEADRCPYRDLDADMPVVRVIFHGDFSIGLRIYVWVSIPDNVRYARFWLYENVKKRFDREGVEIPFPYKTFVYKKDLPRSRRQFEAFN